MYRLRIIVGPNRGASYNIEDGENSIGRTSENAVMVASSKVSKRHCVLVAENGELVLKDQGSSNGTFVNGILTKSRKVKPGDRISVGETIFEVVERAPQGTPGTPALANGDRALGNVLPFPSRGGAGLGIGINTSQVVRQAEPTDLKSRLVHLFETHLMPFFYEFNLKNEWKLIGAALFAFFALVAVVGSIMPLMDTTRSLILEEAKKRATYIAKQIVEKNAAIVAAGADIRAEIPLSIEKAEGVKLALLANLDGRIIAPANRLNDYVAGIPEADFAVEARKRFGPDKDRSGFTVEPTSSTVTAFEPVRVVSTAQSKNVAVAMAIVSIDVSSAVLGSGELAMIYCQAFICVILFGALIFAIFYRMTLKPFETLNLDMDKVLKGELQAVSRNHRFEEMNPLWDLINSALQRAANGSPNQSAPEDTGPSADDYIISIRGIADVSPTGVVVCAGDHRALYMNAMFERITGINANSLGQNLATVARDDAFTAIVNDSFAQIQVGSTPVTQEFEFPMGMFQVTVAAFGAMGKPPACFVMNLVAVES